MNLNQLVVPLITVLLALCLGCDEEPQTSPAQAAVSASVDTAADQDPVATVNGLQITLGEVRQEIQNMMRQYQGRVPDEQLATMADAFQTKALDNLITTRLLVGAAEAEQITVEESSIEAKMNDLLSRFPSPEVFEEQLTSMGLSKEEIREEIIQSLEIQTLLDGKLAEALEVSEEEIAKFYQENPDSFQKPEEVQASHILLANKSDATDEDKQKNHDKLVEIRKQLADGADFAATATEHSDCPSNAKGGDLGFFSKDKMVPEFSDVAFQLQVGELSEIVETPFGYHLIKVTDHHDAGTVPMEEVREEVKSYLGNQNQQKAFEKYVAGLRESSVIAYEDGYQPELPPLEE